MTETEQYLLKKYDYIPISAELIEHVRRLDGFNVSHGLKFFISFIIRRRNLSSSKA